MKVPNTSWTGYVAFGWGLLFAAVSFYWASGGTYLLDTLGGSIEEMARRGDPIIYAAGWITGALKVLGAALALALVRPWGRRLPRRPLLFLAWCAAVLLTVYGAVLVGAEALVAGGVVKQSTPIAWKPLLWHLWIWDMSFLLWGLLFIVALRQFRRAVRVASSTR